MISLPDNIDFVRISEQITNLISGSRVASRLGAERLTCRTFTIPSQKRPAIAEPDCQLGITSLIGVKY